MDELRRDRARKDRMYLLDQASKTEPVHLLIYAVQGTTGVYEVRAAAPNGLQDEFLWNCSCPDFDKRRRPCKHIYFVRNRVLGQEDVRVDSDTLWQIATSRSDPGSEQREVATRKPYVGENCVICFDEMTEADATIWCSGTCGNSVHAECYRIWSKRSGDSLCVYCRQPMVRRVDA
jgi:hypothetical protein